MRYLNLATAALFGMTAMSALAQTPSGMDPTTGARPGHEPGVGVSLPLSTCANALRSSGVTVGVDGTTSDYLHAARAALVTGSTCQAQHSLDMAETRALNRSVVQGQEKTPDSGQLVSRIRDVRRAMNNGNNAQAIQLVDLALSS